MKELKKYYRQIKDWLPCGGPLKRKLMGNITATIEGYIAEHPQADFTDLQTHFGTPQQIATAFVDEMDTQELLHSLRIRRRILRTVFFGIAAAVSIWGIVMLILLITGLANELGTTTIHPPVLN